MLHRHQGSPASTSSVSPLTLHARVCTTSPHTNSPCTHWDSHSKNTPPLFPSSFLEHTFYSPAASAETCLLHTFCGRAVHSPTAHGVRPGGGTDFLSLSTACPDHCCLPSKSSPAPPSAALSASRRPLPRSPACRLCPCLSLQLWLQLPTHHVPGSPWVPQPGHHTDIEPSAPHPPGASALVCVSSPQPRHRQDPVKPTLAPLQITTPLPIL